MKKILLSGLIAAVAFGIVAKTGSEWMEEAKKMEDKGRFEIALPLYLKADSAFVADHLENSPEYAQALHSTGRAYFNNDNILSGRKYTAKAAELRQRLFGKLSKEYVTSLNNYALSYLMAGDLESALKYQTEVVDFSREIKPEHPSIGMYLINLGRIHHGLGNEREAIRAMEEALPKVEKHGKDYEYILNFLGSAYMDMGDNANANRILGLMDEHNRHELEKECTDPQCRMERAEYFISSGQPAKAKDEFMALFAMPLTDEDKATAYEQYARFMTGQNDFAEAGEYYALASEASRKAEEMNEKAIFLLRQAGLCYFVGKEYAKSLDAHKKVVEGVDRYGYAPGLKSSSLQGIGNCYSALKSYDKAIEAFTKWIEHLEATGHAGDADYAKAYERRAATKKYKGDYDASLEDYDNAIALYDKLGMADEMQQAVAGKSLCLTYAKRESDEFTESDAATTARNQKLRDTLQSSLDILEQGGEYLGKLSNARSLATIAGCYLSLEDFGNALKYYEQYLPAIREAIAEDFLLKSLKERELTWQRELGTLQEMEAMIALLPENPDLYGRMSHLIYESELLSKGILLSSAVEFEKVLKQYGTKDMRSKYEAIKSNLERISQMKQERKPMEDILALSRETDAMQLALAHESAEYADFMNYLRVSTSDIANAIGRDDVAIEFTTLDTAILSDKDLVVAAVVSKEYPTGLVLPVATVDDIKKMTADPGKYTDEEYGMAIWGRIIQAVGDKKRIFFAPEGELNNLAIEYLPLLGKPASEQLEIIRLSSTRELAREHKDTPLMYASMFGGIDYGGYDYAAENQHQMMAEATEIHREGYANLFLNLYNTLREVREVMPLLKKRTKSATEYTGVRAGKTEFLSQGNGHPLNLLHIGTHGKYIDEKKINDNRAMDNSILALAGANLDDEISGNRGIVTAAEIAEMNLRDCDLVVLSACESGLGKLGADGVFGLQRGFKNAGVKSLLVSLNSVADRATADMMIAFYKNLLSGKGMSKREALRKAQSETRAKYPDDSTWASFILIDAI